MSQPTPTGVKTFLSPRLATVFHNAASGGKRDVHREWITSKSNPYIIFNCIRTALNHRSSLKGLYVYRVVPDVRGLPAHSLHIHWVVRAIYV